MKNEPVDFKTTGERLAQAAKEAARAFERLTAAWKNNPPPK